MGFGVIQLYSYLYTVFIFIYVYGILGYIRFRTSQHDIRIPFEGTHDEDYTRAPLRIDGECQESTRKCGALLSLVFNLTLPTRPAIMKSSHWKTTIARPTICFNVATDVIQVVIGSR